MPSTKPWWTSKTIWAGIGTIVAGLASAAYAQFVQHDPGQALAELGSLLATGGTAIYGRLTASAKIDSAGA